MRPCLEACHGKTLTGRGGDLDSALDWCRRGITQCTRDHRPICLVMGNIAFVIRVRPTSPSPSASGAVLCVLLALAAGCHRSESLPIGGTPAHPDAVTPRLPAKG